jgi:hypothetical protein
MLDLLPGGWLKAAWHRMLRSLVHETQWTGGGATGRIAEPIAGGVLRRTEVHIAY